MNSAPKVTIGILLYHSRKYLPDCLSTLRAQDYPNLEITLRDNASGEGGDYEWVKANHPEIAIKKGPNIGFGAGHNALIRKATGEFYACLNVDMRFEPDFIRWLVEAVQKDPEIAVATGKLLRWDFGGPNQGKTTQIDTVGLKYFRSHRFEDEGQGSEDTGQYDTAREIFGSSGAAFLARMEALKDVGYFDELFFMYKEDIDLAYRLRWAGWKAVYTPKAVAYHDRTTANLEGGGIFSLIANRKSHSQRVKEWSYLNHEIMLRKNYSGFSWRVRLATAWYQFKTYIYIFCFERYLLKKRAELRALMPQIEVRRAALKRRVAPKAIEQWMA
ncbi:glycosyltransferase family 2 protein [Candidatus Peregrinibacteria bacterium]|nr:glycosyltransferase family 2 protein [Candidatus Peregrinibacteria bacterium]